MTSSRVPCTACGHPLCDHNDSLDCRTCKQPCGIDCSGMVRPHERAALARPTEAARRQLDDDWLAASCWCRSTTVGVPRTEIQACLTRTCGRKKCQP